MGLIWHRMWCNGDHFMNCEMEFDKARIYLLTEQLLAYQLYFHRDKVKEHNSRAQQYLIKFLKCNVYWTVLHC